MPRGRKRTNEVYKYFNLNYEENTSQCTIGGCQKKIKGHHGSNLVCHLKSSHRTQHEEIIEANQSTIAQTSTNDNKVNNVLNECIKLVTVHARPFNLINDTAFQNLIKMILPNPNQHQIINMHRIRSEISEAAEKNRLTIAHELRNKLFCIKIDAASCRDRSFLGVNAQYISDGKIILRTLGVIELEQRHTSDFLKEKLITLLWKYQIDTKQIYSITTDNGANMIKMIRLVNEEMITVRHTDEEDNDFLEDDYYLLNDQPLPDVELNDEEAINYKVTGVRCAAHTLQLAVHDALGQDPIYVEALEKARIMIRMLRRPNIMRLFKESNSKKPILDCATRWDSTFSMVSRLLEVKEIVNIHLDLISFNINDTTWNHLADLKGSLEPANILSKMLQKEQLTFGDFWYEWLKCILKIKKTASPFSIALALALENRQKTLLNNEPFLSAIYLDPRFNAILTRDEIEKSVKHLVNTWSRLVALQELAPTVETETPNIDNDSSSAVVSVDDEIENILHVADLNRQSRLTYIIHTTNIDKEEVVRDFLRFPRLEAKKSVLEYWEAKKSLHSQLYPLALTVLSVPATQVSVERIFSSLKYILSPLRHNMLGDAVNDILVIQQNQ